MAKLGIMEFDELCNAEMIDRNDDGHVSSSLRDKNVHSTPIISVPRSCFESVTKENRFKFFMKNCPVCNGYIAGRPAEWPYYIRADDMYLFLCDRCAYIRHVNVIDDDTNQVVTKFDLRAGGHHEERKSNKC